MKIHHAFVSVRGTSIASWTFVLIVLTGPLAATRQSIAQGTSPKGGHYLYVAVPGTDADLADHSVPGILVFDIDNGHKFVRRISPLAKAAIKDPASR